MHVLLPTAVPSIYASLVVVTIALHKIYRETEPALTCPALDLTCYSRPSALFYLLFPIFCKALVEYLLSHFTKFNTF